MAHTTYDQTYSDTEDVKLSDSARIWYGIGGVAFILLAGLAFAIPYMATFAANLWLGALLAAAGIIEIIGAFRRHDGWGALAEAVFGIVMAVAGVLAIIFPMAGIFAFTAVIIAFFIFSGIVRIVAGLRRRPQRAWVFNMLSGVISLGLGVFLLLTLPEAAIFTLGVLLAVDFAVFGSVLLMTGIYGERPINPAVPTRSAS